MKREMNRVLAGVIEDWGGSKYGRGREADFYDFYAELKKSLMVDRDIQMLNRQINIAIDRAMDGSDHGLMIKLDDTKLNIDTY